MIQHSAAWLIRDTELVEELLTQYRHNNITRARELIHELAAHRGMGEQHLPDRWAVTKIVATLTGQIR